MKRIKKGDDVVVLTGRDKGKRGSVLKILCNEKALVENINLVKRHTRGNPNKKELGGILKKESPIHLSNLALFNPDTKKGEKIGYKVLEGGQKVRYFKSNQSVIDIQ